MIAVPLSSDAYAAMLADAKNWFSVATISYGVSARASLLADWWSVLEAVETALGATLYRPSLSSMDGCGAGVEGGTVEWIGRLVFRASAMIRGGGSKKDFEAL